MGHICSDGDRVAGARPPAPRLPAALAPGLPARGVICRDWPERCNVAASVVAGLLDLAAIAHLRGGAEPAGVGGVVVAGAARLTAVVVGPAAQQGG